MARPSSCTVALLLGGLLGCSAQTSTGPSVVAASSDSLAEKRARAKQGVEDGVPGLALAPLPPTPRDARRQILKVCLYVVDGSLQRHSLADLLEVATRALNSGSSPRVDVTSSRLQQAQTALDSALIQASTRNPRISAAQLAQTAAVAVVDSLHDSSRYFSAEVLRRFSRKAEATFGMILGKADPYPVVLAVVPDSPAAAAGVQRGDELMEVEGRSTFRMDMLAVGAMLSGLTGSEATLRLAYGADSGPDGRVDAGIFADRPGSLSDLGSSGPVPEYADTLADDGGTDPRRR